MNFSLSSSDDSNGLPPNDDREALEAIRERAAVDREFRELCFNDPAAAIEEVTGFEVPSDFSIRFVEEDGADLTIILPEPDFEDDDGLLSDDDLDLAAGGEGSTGDTAW